MKVLRMNQCKAMLQQYAGGHLELLSHEMNCGRQWFARWKTQRGSHANRKWLSVDIDLYRDLEYAPRLSNDCVHRVKPVGIFATSSTSQCLWQLICSRLRYSCCDEASTPTGLAMYTGALCNGIDAGNPGKSVILDQSPEQSTDVSVLDKRRRRECA